MYILYTGPIQEVYKVNFKESLNLGLSWLFPSKDLINKMSSLVHVFDAYFRPSCGILFPVSRVFCNTLFVFLQFLTVLRADNFYLSLRNFSCDFSINIAKSWTFRHLVVGPQFYIKFIKSWDGFFMNIVYNLLSFVFLKF